MVSFIVDAPTSISLLLVNHEDCLILFVPVWRSDLHPLEHLHKHVSITVLGSNFIFTQFVVLDIKRAESEMF